MSEVQHKEIDVNGLNIHYREAGEGPPVILLHGWPTSSALYRNILPHVGQHCHAIAPDLPGFGRSDKPLDASYSFRYFDEFLTAFVDALDLENVGLVVHDLGGPIGLHWASQNPDRISRVGILNTLCYPELHWTAKAFLLAASTPGIKTLMTSQWGLKKALYFGTASQKSDLPHDAVETFQAPFRNDPDARKALAKAAVGLVPAGFNDIAPWLAELEAPVRVIYGSQDRILPDMPKTAARIAEDCPQAQITEIENAGHFLQEDVPEQVAELLAEFIQRTNPGLSELRSVG